MLGRHIASINALKGSVTPNEANLRAMKGPKQARYEHWSHSFVNRQQNKLVAGWKQFGG